MEDGHKGGSGATREGLERAQRIGDLEIHQDLGFESRNWRAQRVGWVLMTAFVLAGLAGLFGRGPLAYAEATSPGGLLRVDYERFTRHGSAAELRLTVAPAAATDGVVRVLVSRPFLQGQQIEDIQPEPVSVVVAGETVMYTFNVRPGNPAHILIRVSSDVYALQTAEVSLPGGPERVRLRQLVFP